MKFPIFLMGTTFFVLSCLPGPAMAGPIPKGPVQDRDIQQVLTGLQSDAAQVEKYRSDLRATQEELETRLFGTEDRDQVLDRLGMDEEALMVYLDEGLNEVSYLKDHWARLTSNEKDLVEQAAYDLD